MATVCSIPTGRLCIIHRHRTLLWLCHHQEIHHYPEPPFPVPCNSETFVQQLNDYAGAMEATCVPRITRVCTVSTVTGSAPHRHNMFMLHSCCCVTMIIWSFYS